VPGIESVSLSGGSTPMATDSALPFWLEGEPKPLSQAEMKMSLFFAIQPDYLKVMKVPLKRGRFLSPSDTARTPIVTVIDQRFAKQFFGDQDPLGRPVNLAILNQTAEIVGITGHLNEWGLDSDSTNAIQAQCYMSLEQLPDSMVSALERGASGMVR